MCDQKFSQQCHLKTHIESVHKKVKYPCYQCEYKAPSQGGLKRHIETVHCEYQAAQKRDVKNHIESLHDTFF